MPQHHGRNALAVLALAAAAAVPAAASRAGGDEPLAAALAPPEPTCGGYESLRVMLDERFGERPTSSGLADDGSIMLVFSAPGATTWTMVTLTPDGTACVLATGQSWEHEALARQGDPA